MKTFAIILLAGSSTRFSSETKKQFFEIKNKPLMLYSLETFDKSKVIDEIVLVVAPTDFDKVQDLINSKGYKKISSIVKGGKLRQESVKNGLDAIKKNEGIVLIHDAARPLVDNKIIIDLKQALERFDGVSPALESVNTIARVDKDGKIISFENRNELYQIQTPQAFKLEIIKQAHENSKNSNATDDLQLVKQINKTVGIIPGNQKYLKVTTQSDIKLIEDYLKEDE